MTTTWRSRAAAAFAVVALVFGAACGDDGDNGEAAPAGGDDESTGVVIKDFKFTGLEAEAGQELPVKNEDSLPHSVEHDDPKAQFDSRTVAGGATGKFTAPTEPGTYKVQCGIHGAQMTGELVVT